MRKPRFVNIDNSGENRGITLGPRLGFDTPEAAVKAAKRRSKKYKKGLKQRTSR